MEEPKPIIRLVTSDGKSTVCDESIIHASGFLQNMVRDYQSSNQEGPIDVSLPNTNSIILSKVAEFCQHHRNDLPWTAETISKLRQEATMEHWDEQFCKVDQKTLFDLMISANFLNIPSLLEVTCKTVADMIRGKSPDEIRSTFNIEKDLTPEEEEAIRQENVWCLDDQ
jgi:S-phase kinase-associated protein 1